jgi:Glycosyltransferase WbsX
MKRYAIFFPQFHRVKINDNAWGYGFTDWALVAAANAFNSWSRRAPACGFYDLSKAADIRGRFEAASTAGLDGFGIYHYRFEDGGELDAVERYLHQVPPPVGFNYFFIWANEDWSRRWVNNDTKILKYVPKAPSREQIADHVKYLKPYMESDSYTKVAAKPIFVIYRPDWFTDAEATVKFYREEFDRAELNVSIGYFAKNVLDIEYSKLFDFCYMFEPRMFFNCKGLRRNTTLVNAYKKLLSFMSPERGEWLSEHINRLSRKDSNKFSFAEFLSYFKSEDRQQLVRLLDCPMQNVLTSGWNNVPRYRQYFTQVDVPNPEQFSVMLELSLGDRSCSEHIPLLCNAWNEWSEGAAIEPCAYLGDALLKSYLHRDELSERGARID